jgi:polysaccharide deacetylase family protein (PEP-CTERM system associated)
MNCTSRCWHDMESTRAAPNVFTVDLEDWYQGLEIDLEHWAAFVPRIERGLNTLLDLLDSVGVSATFFVLGYQAEQTPRLIRSVISRGHEIASHGYSHRFVYLQGPAEFRLELRRGKEGVEQITGQSVLGYRAPFFSITADSQWALDVLIEEGFAYDSSIFPVFNYRYGIPTGERFPAWLSTPSGARIFEIPLSTLRLPRSRGAVGINVPVGGGGYFRLYPYPLTRWLVQGVLREQHGLVFYVHPWEYDPDHPRVRLPRRLPEITHYLNLESTAKKTQQLLKEFPFTTMRAAYGDVFAPPGPG